MHAGKNIRKQASQQASKQTCNEVFKQVHSLTGFL